MQRLGSDYPLMMKRYILFFLLGLTILSCVKKQQPELGINADEVISEKISAELFQKMMDETGNLIILDVRTAEEVAAGYIEGAINIDFRSPEFKSKLDELNRNATYMVYCASGGRSGNTTTLMKEMKFRKVYDLEGGFKGWSGKGFPFVLPE